MSAALKNPIQSFTRNAHIPLRLRKKIGKLCKPVSGRAFRVSMFGMNYEGQTGHHIDNKIFQYGAHESATIRLMRAILRWQAEQNIRPVFLDIGTNVGAHLLAVAPVAAQSCGFEPWGPVRARALHNLNLNILPPVTVFPFGLSDEDGQLSFTPPAQENLGTGLFSESNEGSIALQVRRGDDVMREHGIIPTVIKIDVEGFERRVIMGLGETIRTHKPAIVFEYSTLSRPDFGPAEKRLELFGPDYTFFGIRRSREFPSLEAFAPQKRYENVLAWPSALPPKLNYHE